MIEHLDRIERLGFTVNLNWNKCFDIIYVIESQWTTDVRVLFCSYDSVSEPSYEDIVETSCDFFYMWYNKNLEILKDFELDSTDDSNTDRLVESGLGDITKQVYRDFNIDTLLD